MIELYYIEEHVVNSPHSGAEPVAFGVFVLFFVLFCFFEIGSLCVVLAVLELTL